MRLYTGAAIDLYGHNQTISLMTSGDSTAIITNSAPNTVSTLTIGYGMEPATRNCPYTFNDNPSIGAYLALRKINTAPYAYPPTAPTQTVTNGVQNMTGVCTYSGDTTVEGGGLILECSDRCQSQQRLPPVHPQQLHSAEIELRRQRPLPSVVDQRRPAAQRRLWQYW